MPPGDLRGHADRLRGRRFAASVPEITLLLVILGWSRPSARWKSRMC
jgi:hypothetical protein